MNKVAIDIYKLEDNLVIDGSGLIIFPNEAGCAISIGKDVQNLILRGFNIQGSYKRSLLWRSKMRLVKWILRKEVKDGKAWGMGVEN
jgi:hypothetical protein